MKKVTLILFVIFFSGISVPAQKVELPELMLSGIKSHLSIKNIPQNINHLTIIINDSTQLGVLHKTDESTVDYEFTIAESGRFNFLIKELNYRKEITVLPGWISVIPPLLAILLALLVREVVTSLLAGIYIGALFIYNFDPLTSFLRMTDTIMLNSLADKDHITIIVFTLLFGGLIGIIAKNGGTVGISNLVIKFAKTARSGLISSWAMGLFIFFDDYANSLIIGNMMRPITDKLRISREKLAYIVDSTAAPVASLVIISSWIGFEVGLIQAGLNVVGSSDSAYDIFLQTIVYRFYPIAALVFVFLTSFLGRDFGPMYKAEKRARTEGILFENDVPVDTNENLSSKFKIKNAKWWNGFIPVMFLILATICGLIFTGIDSLESSGIKDYGLRQIISESNSFSSLLWASFGATILAVVMTVSQRIMSLTRSITAVSKGLQSMLFACVILVLAWSISLVTNELKTADYLISILSDTIDPRFLPVLVFIVCALISFSTGTSWGTMAIVMPIVIPLTVKITTTFGMNATDAHVILVGVVSSVLAGSVFGDHCSPIADTTVLSSIASHCNHIDHVRTQLPYAVVVAMVCMLLGDIPTAFGFNPLLSIFLIILVLLGILLLFGKKLPVVKVES